MSAPPISSPRTKTCGIVGQLDTAESSCRIRGSGSTSTAVTGAPARLEQRQPVEARARHGHLEVVATARAVLDGQLGRVRKRLREQAPKMVDAHFEFRRWWARYSSRSERVIMPIGRPSLATTTAF